MDIKNFNPYVRFCSTTNIENDYPKTLKAYDFRLFHVLEGGFTAIFDDRKITVQKGSSLIFPPNTAYRLMVDKCGKSKHITVNFDFVTDNYGATAHAPSVPEEYNESEIFSNRILVPFDRIFYLSDTQFCTGTLKEMCREMRSNNLHSQEMASALLKKLLVEFIRKDNSSKKKLDDNSVAICKKIKDCVGENLTGELTNITVAKELGYHPYYINSIFKKVEGVTLHSYIISQKIDLAKYLLLSTNLPIAKISEQCGFSGASYFSECFAKNSGVTPSEYREKSR